MHTHQSAVNLPPEKRSRRSGPRQSCVPAGLPFAWVGGFSSAPNTKPPADLIKDHAAATEALRMLYLACGDKDSLFRITEQVHQMLDEKGVPHHYNAIPGGQHDFKVWKSDLYHFTQLLFR